MPKTKGPINFDEWMLGLYQKANRPALDCLGTDDMRAAFSLAVDAKLTSNSPEFRAKIGEILKDMASAKALAV